MTRRPAGAHPSSMALRSEDRDFLTFRDEGEPEALARVFDALAPRLLLLAAHLAPDAAQAEDLVQTTFLHAMRDAERYDGARPVSLWLGGILRHRALDARRRSAVRRAEPLDDETPEGPGVDAATLAADQELVERVGAAVDALEDPYREVLVLRLVHGLEPTEIAHALGRRPGTVRMQLQRGLERLRREMPQLSGLLGFVLDDGALGLAAVREAVLAEARALAGAATLGSAGATATGVTATGTGILGGLLAMKAVWIAIAVGLGTFWITAGGEGPGAATEVAQERGPSGPARPRSRALAELAAASAPDGARAVVLPATAPEPSRSRATPAGDAFVVQVRYRADGAPAGDVGLYLRPKGGDELGIDLRTDADGRALFVDPPRGPAELHVDRVAEPYDAAPAPGESLEVWIPRGTSILGRVVDLEGAGIAGARVYRSNEHHHDLFQEIARTGDDGSFELESATLSDELLARADGFQPSRLERPRAERTPNVELVLGARGHELAGRVVDAAGQPVAHAWIAIAPDEDARDSLEGSTRRPTGTGKPLEREAFLVRADPDGRFRTDEVPAGHTLVVARPPESSSEGVGVATTWIPAADAELTVRIARGTRLSGVVRTSSGAPLAGVEVSAEWGGTPALGEFDGDLGPALVDRSTVTDEGGAYELTGLVGGEYTVRVHGDRGLVLHREALVLDDASEAAWSPVLPAGARMRVQLLDPDGSPLAGWGIGIAETDGPWRGEELAEGRTNARGELTLRYLDPRETYRVSAFSPGVVDAPAPMPTARWTDLAPGPGVQVLQLEEADRPEGTLRGSWVGADGAPLAGAELLLSREGRVGERVARTDASGDFVFAGLTAGEYTLRAGRSVAEHGVVLASATLAPAEVHDLGTVGVPATSKLVVELTVNGAPDASRALLDLEPLDGDGRAVELDWSQEGSTWTAGNVLPGAYRLRVWGSDLAPSVVEVRLGSAPETRVVVDREAGVRVRCDVLVPETDDRLLGFHVRIEDAAGDPVVDNDHYVFGQEGRERIPLQTRLAPGTYTITLSRGEPARSTSATLVVPPQGGAPRAPLELDLR